MGDETSPWHWGHLIRAYMLITVATRINMNEVQVLSGNIAAKSEWAAC